MDKPIASRTKSNDSFLSNVSRQIASTKDEYYSYVVGFLNLRTQPNDNPIADSQTIRIEESSNSSVGHQRNESKESATLARNRNQRVGPPKYSYKSNKPYNFTLNDIKDTSCTNGSKVKWNWRRKTRPNIKRPTGTAGDKHHDISGLSSLDNHSGPDLGAPVSANGRGNGGRNNVDIDRRDIFDTPECIMQRGGRQRWRMSARGMGMARTNMCLDDSNRSKVKNSGVSGLKVGNIFPKLQESKIRGGDKTGSQQLSYGFDEVNHCVDMDHQRYCVRDKANGRYVTSGGAKHMYMNGEAGMRAESTPKGYVLVDESTEAHRPHTPNPSPPMKYIDTSPLRSTLESQGDPKSGLPYFQDALLLVQEQEKLHYIMTQSPTAFMDMDRRQSLDNDNTRQVYDELFKDMHRPAMKMNPTSPSKSVSRKINPRSPINCGTPTDDMGLRLYTLNSDSKRTTPDRCMDTDNCHGTSHDMLGMTQRNLSGRRKDMSSNYTTKHRGKYAPTIHSYRSTPKNVMSPPNVENCSPSYLLNQQMSRNSQHLHGVIPVLTCTQNNQNTNQSDSPQANPSTTVMSPQTNSTPEHSPELAPDISAPMPIAPAVLGIHNNNVSPMCDRRDIFRYKRAPTRGTRVNSDTKLSDMKANRDGFNRLILGDSPFPALYQVRPQLDETGADSGCTEVADKIPFRKIANKNQKKKQRKTKI